MTVTEFFQNPDSRLYHITLASNKESILKNGLLCCKQQSPDFAGKLGIYVSRSSDIRILSSIARSQKGYDDSIPLIIITINPQKHHVSARDLAPDLHTDVDSRACSKIIKDILNIDESDISEFKIGNADVNGMKILDLKEYNVALKPEKPDIGGAIYSFIDWSQQPL